MKPKRIRHTVRINPETHDPEFTFYFRHNPDDPVGWFTTEQVIEAARHAKQVVTDSEFERIQSIEFPEYNSRADSE